MIRAQRTDRVGASNFLEVVRCFRASLCPIVRQMWPTVLVIRMLFVYGKNCAFTEQNSK